jgi:mxaJ protein
MFSRFLRLALEEIAPSNSARAKPCHFKFFLWVLGIAFCSLDTTAHAATVKVCADPNNLPFSDQQQEGFENKIARLLARDLNAQVSFQWQRMGRGFLRDVMNKGTCDVLLGVPVGMRGLLVTQPYYRSSYVLVSRADDRPIHSLDDPALRGKKIGVQVLEEDYAPPAGALASRGLSAGIRGYAMENPGAIVAAVADGTVDLAIVWGPLAGYFAARYGKRLRLEAVQPTVDVGQFPFTYAIAAGVRRDAPELYTRLSAALAKEREPIQQILRNYHIPLLPLQTDEQAKSGE